MISVVRTVQIARDVAVLAGCVFLAVWSTVAVVREIVGGRG